MDERGEEKRTVLLAEDDWSLRQLITHQLERGGFNVFVASDGREGMELCERNKGRIDLILSDLLMPGVSGLEFARYNASSDFLPFVVYSSMYDELTARMLIKAGVHDYLLKPIDQRILIGTIRHALVRAKMRGASICQLEPDGRRSIVIKSTREEIAKANDWISGQIKPWLTADEARLFAYHLSELLVNAYEHGNLGLGEKLKSALIINGRYEMEIESKEGLCAKSITIDTSIINGMIEVTVSDEGAGFDYGKYINMTEGAIIDRLSLPNGRGILMSGKYFDSMKYHNGGSSVIVTKSISKDMRPGR